MSYIFGFCLVYTEKNYLHISVGENIKQRLKDFFFRKKKIKSFHSGLAILLGFFFFVAVNEVFREVYPYA